MRSVLAGIQSAEDIYSDPLFGMDTISKLYFWMQACFDGTTTGTTYKAITDYFTSKGIVITDIQM